MAIKRICDRCGAEIIPQNSATYVRIRSASDGRTGEYNENELCVSCGMKIRELLKPVNIPTLSRKESDHA